MREPVLRPLPPLPLVPNLGRWTLNVGCSTFSLLFLLFAGSSASAGEGGAALDVVRVDLLERVFPDRWPAAAAQDEAISVPRVGTVAFQFAVRGPGAGRCTLSVGRIARSDGAAYQGKATLYELLPVHVEANTQGSMRTRVGGRPPAAWMKSFVRQAPFDAAEVLVETDTLRLKPGRTHAVLLDVAVPVYTEPGIYAGALAVKRGPEAASAPFAFRVHTTGVLAAPALHTTHWLWPEPKLLTSGDPPSWWSETHWRLLARAGRLLRACGQDTVFTPLVNYRVPLIQTVRRADGSYRFDYMRFDRWVGLFMSLGFETIEGHHIASLPHKAFGGVFVRDDRTGKTVPLLSDPRDRDAWLRFLPAFYGSLQIHLWRKRWTHRYIQHQLDEPKDAKLAELARRHMPDVRTIDAINSRPAAYSPLVDIQVFNLTALVRGQELVRQRRAEGRAVWLYHCTSPYPPYPNRHLDRPLAECRLWPWLCFRHQADGFLYWAANLYRGADEYATSIGPLPNGSQNPGHPPGDAWFFYRGPDGLRGSLRMIAFRDGLLDHTLLTMLAKKKPALAASIARQIAPSPTGYAKDPSAYHAARKALLMGLDATTR